MSKGIMEGGEGIPFEGASDGEETLDRETAYEILGNTRRRHALHLLLQRKESLELRELSNQISAWENEISPEEVTHQQRKRVYTALRQTHLPKMDDEGVVNYDKNRGVIEPTDEVAELEFYLDVVPEKEISRGEYYLGLSLVAAGVAAAVWAGAVPFDAFSDFTWMVIVIVAFLVSAAVDTYFERSRRLGHDGPPPEIDHQH